MSQTQRQPSPSSFAAAVARGFAQPVRSKADATTELILKAGAEELTAFGFRRTTIDNVAQRAGVARMTVYRRFASKEALAEAILAREVVRLMRAIDRSVDRSAPFDVRWVEGFVATMRAIRKHGLLQRLFVSDPEETVVALSLRAEPILALARGFLAGAIRAHVEGCDPRHADWAAETALRLLQSFALTPSRSLKVDEAAELREYARRNILPLLLSCSAGHSP